MLNSIMHRDLANPLHKTNIAPDYNMPHPSPDSKASHPVSFFNYPPHEANVVLTPLNPHSNHKPMNMIQFLSKRLRWLTLGSQYDWKTRVYAVSINFLLVPY